MGIEASLRRLGTEWLDLYQIHCWDARTPLEETRRHSTTSSTRARSATRERATTPHGSSPSHSVSPRVAAGRASSRCSPSIRWSRVTSNASCFPSAVRKASACSPGARSPAASSPGSTARVRTSRRGRGAATPRSRSRSLIGFVV
jgi:hypothetical protein